jgi:DNA-binding NarL/FixJ family response regulator
MTNPWNLSPRQCEALDALVQVGCNKKIASALGIENPDALKNQFRRACEKVGVENRVQLAVAWDRWKAGRTE